MKKSIVEAKLKQAIDNLFENQPNIYDFTDGTGQTEWNLAHHLAYEIHKLFSAYDCDLDVTKHNYEERRPDIIFHKRNSHDSNFLVVEIKKDGTRRKMEDDIQKIKNFWFEDRLKYKFGAYINLKSNKTGEIKVIENE